MTRIGVRGLKDHLSEYVKRAGAGERIVVTDRGEPTAVLTSFVESEESRWGWGLVRERAASWGGGKPRGSTKAATLKGKKTTAEMVLEDRR